MVAMAWLLLFLTKVFLRWIMKRIITIAITITIICGLAVNGFSQNFGIDQSNPTEKLDVNGNIKTHAIKFPDGSLQTKAPRVIHTTDTRGGCPGSWPANTDLISHTFVLDATAAVSTSAAIIRLASGRVDLQLYVDGGFADQTLTYTSSNQWEDAYVQWAGNLSAGTHTISIRSATASVWGCGSSWGSLDTIIFE